MTDYQTDILNREIKRHFGSIAKVYANQYKENSVLSHLFSVRMQMVIDLLGDVGGMSILDIGCGPGMTADFILPNGGQFFGVDLSEEMLNECRLSFYDIGELYLSVGNMNTLPFSSASFDRILCLGVIEYVRSADVAIREIYRVLKTGGFAVISMQNKLSPYRIWDLHVYHNYYTNNMRKKVRGTSSEPILETNYALREFRTILNRGKFTVMDALYYDFNLLVKPLDRLFPRLSVYISKKLEFLSRSKLGVLGTGYIVKAYKTD